jgi:cellulose synthase/poly-beta-1,6-N-acetylglucosamine synthase-like glycosyltransferase
VSRARQEDFSFLLGVLPDERAIRMATDRARAIGVLPQDVLIAAGHLGAGTYVEALAGALGLVPLRVADAHSILLPGDEPTAAPSVAATADGTVIIDPLLLTPAQIARIAGEAAADGRQVRLAMPGVMREAALAGRGDLIAGRAIDGLRSKAPHFSAARQASLGQLLALAILAGVFAGGLAFAPRETLAVLLAVLSLPFLMVVALRLLALGVAIIRREPAARLTRRSDRDLPVYTILVPLFGEARVLPDLIRALNRLDYPREKLDIKLILEEVDSETRAAAGSLDLSTPFDILVVPDRQPRTKPKALNFALPFVRGSYLTVFDAEDVPEPSELKEALGAFDAGGPDLACLQARLAIDNAGDGFLARQFAIEYAALFDGLLPALAAMGVPIPLGGTSNHFRIEALRRAGAWDAWNVTEDADLGIRLARFGYRTGILRATTSEEAPFRLGAWLRQRTRWLKGWMQTALVHSRRPWSFVREAGVWRAISVATLSGGIILSALVHPFFTGAVIAGAMLGAPFGHPESPIGRAFWWIALANLLAGYGASMALAAIAVCRRRRWGLLPHVALLPFYWQLVSIAAYRALWQLVREPHLWEKTEHGLGSRRDFRT